MGRFAPVRPAGSEEAADWRVLGPLVAAALAAAMSMTIMPVAVPAIGRDFALAQDQVHWVSTGFMAAMTFAMLWTPWLMARFSVRGVYAGSVLMLASGAVAASVAPSFVALVLARLVEGGAAGLLQPLPVIIVSHAFAQGQRGRAMGVFMLGTVLAPAVSPLLGGFLLERWGWRAVSLALVPIALFALTMGGWLNPYDLRRSRSQSGRRQGMDVVGMVSGGMALVGILLALSSGRVSGPWTAVGWGLMSAVAALVFIRRQRRQAHPILDLQVFADRRFSMTCVVAFAYGLGMFGSAYLTPVFMQQALGRSAVEAGAVMLPAGLLLAVGSPFGGWLSDRLPAHRVLAAGMGLLAMAFVGFLGMGVTSPISLVVWLLLLSRLGMALVLPTLNLSAMKSLPDARWTDGATAINLIRQLGASMGVSAVAAFLQWRLNQTPQDPVSSAHLPVSAFHDTFALVACIVTLGAWAAWHARAGRLPER